VCWEVRKSQIGWVLRNTGWETLFRQVDPFLPNKVWMVSQLKKKFCLQKYFSRNSIDFIAIFVSPILFCVACHILPLLFVIQFSVIKDELVGSSQRNYFENACWKRLSQLSFSLSTYFLHFEKNPVTKFGLKSSLIDIYKWLFPNHIYVLNWPTKYFMPTNPLFDKKNLCIWKKELLSNK